MRPVVALTLAPRRALTQSTEERRAGRWVAILLDGTQNPGPRKPTVETTEVRTSRKKWDIATGQNGHSTELGNATKGVVPGT